MTYRNNEERAQNVREEKAKLAKKLRESRQKMSSAKIKKYLSRLLTNPALLIGKRVIRNCIEDGAEQPQWFNGTVVRLADDSVHDDAIQNITSNMTLKRMNGPCLYSKI